MCFNKEECVRDKVIDCLLQQLSEYELLKSMYPSNDEIVLTDSKVIEDIHNFMNNKFANQPNHLDFVAHLLISGLKLEVCVNLPSFYPLEEPDIYVRCNDLNRQQETMLNNALSDYINENYSGDVCIYTAISWLQDNTELFNDINTSKSVPAKVNNNDVKQDSFTRYWIYSHHIYNKKKRDEIVKRARELELTGFCLPGKPGIICIEGLSSACKDWWMDIRSMTWKKIVTRKIESFNISEKEKQQKFKKFDEIRFENPASRHNKHTDMGGFSKFMSEHGLGQIFQELFGLSDEFEGKTQ